MTAREFTYVVRSDPEIAAQHLTPDCADHVGDGLEVRVVLAEGAVLVDPSTPERARFDVRADEVLHLDDEACVYTRGPRPPTESGGPTYERTDRRRRDEEGRSLRLSRLDVEDWTVSVWTRSFPHGGRGLREFSRHLLPGDSAPIADLGLPVEVRFAPAGRGVEEGVHLELADQRVVEPADAELRVPEGYEPAGAGDRETADEDIEVSGGGVPEEVDETLEDLAEEFADLEEAASAVASLLGFEGGTDRRDDGGVEVPVAEVDGEDDGRVTVETGSTGGDARTRGQALGGGSDLAWIESSDFLDTVEDLVNAVSGALGTFSGKGPNGEMQVTADWWSQLSSSLSFTDSDGNDVTSESIDAVKRLAVYFQVFNGADEIGGMTSQQQSTYRTQIRSYDDPQRRAIEFVNEFGAGQGSDTQAIADRYWSDLAEPMELELGPEEITKEDVDNLIDLRLWDFDTELRIDGEPIVDQLAFTRDGLDLGVEVKELRADFEYETDPAGTVGSAACQLLTAGLCAAALHNRGQGTLTVEDIRVAVDVTRTDDGSTLGFDATLDKSETTNDASIDFDTGGLDAPVIRGLATGGEELQRTVDDKITSAVTDRLDDFPPDVLPRWPNTWKARDGPTISLEGGEIDAGEQVLRADVAQRGGLGSRPGPVRADDVDHLGYALSEPYLEAWLREYTGLLSREVTVGADVESEFDVSLPDPATQDTGEDDDAISDSGTSCGADPAIPDPDYRNDVTLERTAPAVDLVGTTGHSDAIATLTAEYEVTVAAVKEKYFSEALVEEMECGVVGGTPRGGARPDPAPPMGASVAMMLESGATMGDLLGRRGLKVGEAPRETARRQLATYEARARSGGQTDRAATSGLAALVGGDGDGLGREQVAFLNRLTSALLSDPGVSFPVDPTDLPTGLTPAPGGGPWGPDVPWPPDDPFPDEDDDGILDDWDDIPVGPGGGFGGGGGGGTVVCTPPDCTTVIDSRSIEIERYLAVEVDVEMPLYVGFQERGAPWHPEIRLGAGEVSVSHWRIVHSAPELQDVSDDALRQFAVDLVTADVDDTLSTLPDEGSLLQRRTLIPQAVDALERLGGGDGIPGPVFDLAAFEQSTWDHLAYHQTPSHGIWPVEIDETVSDHITNS